MTAYDYYNLPDELNVPAVPEELFNTAFDAFTQALESDQLKAQEIKVAYVYDRNDYMSADAFAGKRNASYTTSNDDVVIQISLRVPNPKGREELSNLAVLEERLTEHNLNVERERLEKEIAAAEETAEKAQAAANQKREQLAKLRQK